MSNIPYNPNPFTSRQEKFLIALRNKLIDIKDPGNEILDNRRVDFYLEHTRKFGTIPKIRFKPNSCATKEEIMIDAGYKPVLKKETWKARRNAAASAFDKYWDGLIFRLVKAGRMLAAFNQRFTEEGEALSDLIVLVQNCIAPERIEKKIASKNTTILEEQRSYLDDLAWVK